jgi:hypothetical protein
MKISSPSDKWTILWIGDKRPKKRHCTSHPNPNTHLSISIVSKVRINYTMFLLFTKNYIRYKQPFDSNMGLSNRKTYLTPIKQFEEGEFITSVHTTPGGMNLNTLCSKIDLMCYSIKESLVGNIIGA